MGLCSRQVLGWAGWAEVGQADSPVVPRFLIGSA